MKDTRDSQDRTSPVNATDERNAAPDNDERSDAESSESQHDDEPARRKIAEMHNTPPPIIVGEGSFFVDLRDDHRFVVKGGGGSGNPKRSAIEPRAGKKYKFHVARILEGNGRTYATWDPHQNSKIYIYATPVTGGSPSVIKCTCNGDFFFEYPAAEELRSKGKGNSSRRVHHRYLKANFNTRITRVRIEDDPGHNYDIVESDLETETWEDFKLMLWIEEVDV